MKTTLKAIRIDDDLIKMINSTAKAENRSFSNMVVTLLKQHYSAIVSKKEGIDDRKYYYKGNVINQKSNE